MGALTSYPERLSNQLPNREVTLSYHFEAQISEVTQAEFRSALASILRSIMIAITVPLIMCRSGMLCIMQITSVSKKGLRHVIK